jgi:hypothetical protein
MGAVLWDSVSSPTFCGGLVDDLHLDLRHTYSNKVQGLSRAPRQVEDAGAFAEGTAIIDLDEAAWPVRQPSNPKNGSEGKGAVRGCGQRRLVEGAAGGCAAC